MSGREMCIRYGIGGSVRARERYESGTGGSSSYKRLKRYT